MGSKHSFHHTIAALPLARSTAFIVPKARSFQCARAEPPAYFHPWTSGLCGFSNCFLQAWSLNMKIGKKQWRFLPTFLCDDNCCRLSYNGIDSYIRGGLEVRLQLYNDILIEEV